MSEFHKNCKNRAARRTYNFDEVFELIRIKILYFSSRGLSVVPIEWKKEIPMFQIPHEMIPELEKKLKAAGFKLKSEIDRIIIEI